MADPNVSAALEILRSIDPERYLTCLYLPENVRGDVASIYTFDAEIRRIPDLVSEPLPGEIRMQWWRDLVASKTVPTDAGPLAANLMDTIIRNELPFETFINYLEARTFDLYHDPMPDTGTYEGYLGETVSTMMQMAALCVGNDRTPELAEACGHAGMAIGTIRLLSRLAIDRNFGKCPLPVQIIDQHGLNMESWLKNDPDDRHLSVVREMLNLTNDHHNKAGSALQSLKNRSRGVFMPLAFVKPLAYKLERSGYSIFDKPITLSPIKRQFTALRAAMFKRY